MAASSGAIKREVDDDARLDRSNKRREISIGSPPASPREDVSSFPATIRGTRFCCVEGVTQGEQLQCARQPENPADGNAIALHRSDVLAMQVGYLPREIAARLAPMLDRGCLTLAVFVRDVQRKRAGSTEIRVEVQVERISAAQGVTREEVEAVVNEAAHCVQGSFSSRSLCENAALLLKVVMRDNSHLLTQAETSIFTSVLHLDPASTTVLLRLYIRKGIWFRLGDLKYVEEGKKEEAVKKLLSWGFLESSETASVEKRIVILSSILRLREIRHFLQSLRSQNVRCCTAGSKHKLTKELDRVLRQVTPLPSLEKVTGNCVSVALRVKRALTVAERLYFLNSSQDLSTFLLQELDIILWPKYQQTIHQSIFPDRRAFDDYFSALQLSAILDDAIEAGRDGDVEMNLGEVWKALDRNVHKITWNCYGSTKAPPNSFPSSQAPTPLFLAQFSDAWVMTRAATYGVRYLEKKKRYEEATEKLRTLLGGNACPARRGDWWTRLIVDLQHIKRFNEALDTGMSALADDWVLHGDRVAIKRQMLKLWKPPKRWKRPPWEAELKKEPSIVRVQACPINHVPGVKSQFLGMTEDPITVEQLALEFYAEKRNGEWKGMHTEGSLWHTLFGILFWDVIFSEVDGVFRTPFQSAPLDFATDAFYLSREADVHRRLSEIRDGRFCDLFVRHWERHHGEMCQGVRWDRYGSEECKEMMMCVGGQRLASLCQILAEDYKAVSGGLPDLFLWNAQRGECKLVEVKGPNDKLSNQQRAWITVLTELKFHVELFKVENK